MTHRIVATYANRETTNMSGQQGFDEGSYRTADPVTRAILALRLLPLLLIWVLALAVALHLFAPLLPFEVWVGAMVVGFLGLAAGPLRFAHKNLLDWEEFGEQMEREEEARTEAGRLLALLSPIEARLAQDAGAASRLEEVRRLRSTAERNLDLWPESSLDDALRAVQVARRGFEGF